MSVAFKSNNIIKPWTNLFLLIMVLCVLPVQGQTRTVQQEMPFVPGEKLIYVLKWESIPAGEAVIEVLPIETLNGEQAYHFVLTARTNSFVDIFYKIRDKIESYTNLEITRSLFYKSKQREGKYKRDIVVSFDWDKQEAQYTNFGKTRDSIPLLPGSFDPLSILFHVRLLDLGNTSQINVPITDGKKTINGTVHVLKRETVEVSGKTYDTYLVEPETKGIGGVFKKSKNAKIYVWLTADERRIPVKVKSKVIVGSFTGELISAEGLQ